MSSEFEVTLQDESIRLRRPLAHRIRALAPPSDALGRVRWGLLVFALAHIVATGIVVLASSHAPLDVRFIVAAALGLLGAAWVNGTLRGGFLTLDLALQLAVITCVFLAVRHTMVVVMILFPGVMLQVSRCSVRHAALTIATHACLLVLVAFSDLAPVNILAAFGPIVGVTAVGGMTHGFTVVLGRHASALERASLVARAGTRLAAADGEEAIGNAAIRALADLAGRKEAGYAFLAFEPVAMVRTHELALDAEALAPRWRGRAPGTRPFVTEPFESAAAPGRAAVVAPLFVEGRLLGALVLQVSGADEEERRDALAMLATGVGLALARASLLGERVKDLERIHQTELRLHDGQKLEALGRLAGGIAHDFNNVLATVATASYLLLEQLPEGSQERADAAEIQAAAERGRRLTGQILAFSRRRAPSVAVLDLNVVVRELDGMLKRLAGRDVSLVLALDPHPLPIAADRGQVEQVVLNLVVNAVDAAPKGHVVVRTQAAPSGDVVLAVSDDGAGMTEEVRSHLFEAFFTTKPEGKGTGLGLSVVKGVVAEAGGQIDVDSQLGKGTTFWIRFPPVKAGLLTRTSG